MQTHLFISPAKFAKILLNYPNYFFISDTHKILKYNIYIYIYIYISWTVLASKPMQIKISV